MKQVHIGIQARTTSTRLPGKIFKNINGSRVLDHVVSQVSSSINYLNKHSHRNGINVKMFLLIPEGDNELKKLNFRHPYEIIEGSEHDVLSRYVKLQKEFGADYICRITSDCPLIPAALITKSIIIACSELDSARGRDFVTNASPECRTYFDGADCEIVNRRALQWLDENAKGDEREHVTQLLYKNPPYWLRASHIFSVIDTSKIKLSIDTEEDLSMVRENYNEVDRNIKIWSDRYGKENVHRF